jgi:toxin ParE1/3/4
MVKLYWTQSALKNLDRIHRYILDQTLSEVIANRYVLKLIMRVEQLKIYPESGQVELLLRKISQNSRYLIEGNYKIIYQVQNSSVIVTDVFHVKQNPTKINSNIKK